MSDEELLAITINIRDYFAARAMQALVALDVQAALSNAEIAKMSYNLADEMLKARTAERRNPFTGEES